MFPNFNSLQFVWSDWTLYSLGIQPAGNYSGTLIPDLSPQSYYIIDDIHRMNREDVSVRITIDWWDIYIYK